MASGTGKVYSDICSLNAMYSHKKFTQFLKSGRISMRVVSLGVIR